MIQYKSITRSAIRGASHLIVWLLMAVLLQACWENGNLANLFPKVIRFNNEILEPEWPIFGGLCFIFQAPANSQVYVQAFNHDTLTYELASPAFGKGWLQIHIGNEAYLSNYERNDYLNIGGVDATYDIHHTEGRTSGIFLLELPYNFPQYLEIRFSTQSPFRLETIMKVINSIRIDADRSMSPSSFSEEDSESTRYPIEPVKHLQLTSAVTKNTPCSLRPDYKQIKQL